MINVASVAQLTTFRAESAKNVKDILWYADAHRATCVGISPREHGGVGAGATRAFKKIKVGGESTQTTLLASFFVRKTEDDVDAAVAEQMDIDSGR